MADARTILDKAKDTAKSFGDRAWETTKTLGGKARRTVGSKAPKLESAVDKTTGFVDDKTKHKYSDKIEKVQKVAHDAVHKVGDVPPEDGETSKKPETPPSKPKPEETGASES